MHFGVLLLCLASRENSVFESTKIMTKFTAMILFAIGLGIGGLFGGTFAYYLIGMVIILGIEIRYR